ncbi:MAG: hypothetical protein WBA39_34705 [Rivularia sp. (in: cyanobacteria)]
MKLSNKKISLISGIGLSIMISGAAIVSSQAQEKPASLTTHRSIKTTDWQNTRIPDWNQITFSTMPLINTDGSFQAPPGIEEKLGYNPNRSWEKGQNIAQFMMLGDFQDSFELQKFSLTDISQIVGEDLSKLNLESFGVIKLQTLGSLVSAIPGLENIPIAEVKPVGDLLSQKLSSLVDANQTIGNLLGRSAGSSASLSPHLSKLDFSEIDLENYNIDSIPGLSSTPIDEFEKWQGTYIDSVPGLKSVPFSQFPKPINAIGGEVGIVTAKAFRGERLIERVGQMHFGGVSIPIDSEITNVNESNSIKKYGVAVVDGYSKAMEAMGCDEKVENIKK